MKQRRFRDPPVRWLQKKTSLVKKPEKEWREEQKPSWKDNPLHSIYLPQIEALDVTGKSYLWKDKNGLKDNIEAQIIVAQEQSMDHRIYHNWQNSGCRLCKAIPETIQHTAAGC